MRSLTVSRRLEALAAVLDVSPLTPLPPLDVQPKCKRGSRKRPANRLDVLVRVTVGTRGER